MPNNPASRRANAPAPPTTPANKIVRGVILGDTTAQPAVQAKVPAGPQATFVGPAVSIRESGGALLAIGAIADGQILVRSGSAIIGQTVMFAFNNLITGLTGGGSANLDGLSAGSLPTGYVVEFNQTGVGARQYQLQVSSLPTGPLVVAASGATGKQWISIL